MATAQPRKCPKPSQNSKRNTQRQSHELTIQNMNPTQEILDKGTPVAAETTKKSYELQIGKVRMELEEGEVPVKETSNINPQAGGGSSDPKVSETPEWVPNTYETEEKHKENGNHKKPTDKVSHRDLEEICNEILDKAIEEVVIEEANKEKEKLITKILELEELEKRQENGKEDLKE